MEIRIFPTSITRKVNVIVRLKFEFDYYDAAVQHVSHCTTKITPPPAKVIANKKKLILWRSCACGGATHLACVR